MSLATSLPDRISDFQHDRIRNDRRSTSWGRRSSRPRLEYLEERTLLSTWTVTDKSDNPLDAGSLRFAVINEPGGTTINFAPSVTGTITLTGGALNITTNLNIEGPGAANLTIDGSNASTVFSVSGGVTATIAGLTIAHGSSTNGGGIANDGTLSLTNCTVASSVASVSGGGIDNEGTLTATSCTIANNVANQFGGGILNDGSLTLTNSTIASNAAPFVAGGGGGIENSGSMVATDSTIAGNSSYFGGGINSSGSATLANTIIAGNSINPSGSGPDFNGAVTTDLGYNLVQDTTGSSGFTGPNDVLGLNPLLGSLRNNGGPTQTIGLMPGSPAIDAGSNALIPSGIATDQRGFSRIVNGTVDIGAFEVQVYVVYNTADHGAGSLRTAMVNADQTGGSTILIATSGVITLASALPAITGDVYMFGPGANVLTVSGNAAYRVFDVQSGVTAAISGLTIDSGSSGTNGGGIENDGTLSLTNCTVSNSSAASNGGGIDNQGTLSLTDSTVAGNSAANNGGGIENDGTLLLVNCTIVGNSAVGGGGIDNAGSMTSINSTVADNSAAGNGGGIDNNGSANLANSIIAYNSLTGGGSGPDFNGTVTTDSGNNLIGDASGSNGLTQPSDLLNVDPLLSSLGYYGGPTETLALLPGSPAIDAGSNALAAAGGNALTTDQRGLPRIVNGVVDIGAFECPGFVITVVSDNNQQTVVNTNFANPLVVLVTSPHGDPVWGGVVSYTPPGGGASATFPGGPNTTRTNFFGVAGINVAANTVAGGYSVGASARGASPTSFNLTNVAGTATKLAFLQQPIDTTYGNTISPAVTVEVVDQYNNLVNSTASITIALGTNPTGATFGGTLLVNAVAGIATFGDLTVSIVGIGYSLQATSNGLAPTPQSSPFNITPRPITVTAAANTKTYDGTTTASAVPTITSGSLVIGDTPNFTEVYSTRNVGIGLTLTPSGTVNDGNGGADYAYTFVPASTGVITAVALTITAVTNTKVYDGTTSAAGVSAITSGVLQGSDTANFIETYNTRNVGIGLTLTPSGTVNDGNGGANYTYTFVPVPTGVITALALTITAVTNTKAYDGTTNAAGVPSITSGSLGTGDTANFVETYNTRNVGVGLTLTPSGTVNDGNGGNNYTYTFVPVSTGVITAEALTITAVTNTKTYDGTPSAAGVPAITSGSLGRGDTGKLTVLYNTCNVGFGLTLTPSGTVND
ncbi:MAG: beta strand repeat-containing protein, partial [Isosphaerales bacterium]